MNNKRIILMESYNLYISKAKISETFYIMEKYIR